MQGEEPLAPFAAKVCLREASSWMMKPTLALKSLLGEPGRELDGSANPEDRLNGSAVNSMCKSCFHTPDNLPTQLSTTGEGITARGTHP